MKCTEVQVALEKKMLGSINNFIDINKYYYRYTVFITVTIYTAVIYRLLQLYTALPNLLFLNNDAHINYVNLYYIFFGLQYEIIGREKCRRRCFARYSCNF